MADSWQLVNGMATGNWQLGTGDGNGERRAAWPLVAVVAVIGH